MWPSPPTPLLSSPRGTIHPEKTAPDEWTNSQRYSQGVQAHLRNFQFNVQVYLFRDVVRVGVRFTLVDRPKAVYHCPDLARCLEPLAVILHVEGVELLVPLVPVAAPPRLFLQQWSVLDGPHSAGRLTCANS